MKPQRTITDHIVECFNPILIMVLVGSLVFFLVDAFYHGKDGGGLRYVLFWFVLAIVLVSRIGMEESPERAAIFGFALAAVTAFRLMATNPNFVFGIFLLCLVWWCSHKLVWNCTYVDDEEDATGRGLVETLPDYLRRKKDPKIPRKPAVTAAEKSAERKERLSTTFLKAPKRPQPPGLWVIYFSAAALPLFGLGQMMINPTDASGRRGAFIYLGAYMFAVLGLFLTTSFLGLRRYLRQRSLKMPRAVGLGWLRFGTGLIAVVLVLAFVLPRPGSNYTLRFAAVALDDQLRRASKFASRWNHHGQGEGKPGQEPGGDQGSAPGANPPPPPDNTANNPSPQGTWPTPASAPAPVSPIPPANAFQNLLRVAVLAGAALLLLWWLVRNGKTILEAIRALGEALRELLGGLNRSTRGPHKWRAPPLPPQPALPPFPSYQNPFTDGPGQKWPPEKIIVYTYEAVQAWARERGVEFPPQLTPREFCEDLGGRFPYIKSELGQLNLYYANTAYGRRAPANYDATPLRELWHHLTH